MASKGDKLEQWCKTVLDFSSQYGSETNISYTVYNLVGPSQIYPSYGDFTQAAVWVKEHFNHCLDILLSFVVIGWFHPKADEMH